LLILTEDEHLQRRARVYFCEVHLRRWCSARGLDWDAMSEPAREEFVVDLIRDNEPYSTNIGPQSETPITCRQCGREVTLRELFRIYFGHRRPSAEQAAAKLIVQDVGGMNVQFPVLAEGETTIGRMDPIRGINPEIDLTRFDPGARVSRRHAKITARESQFFVEDLGSSNGTIINGGLRLKRGEPYALNDGDELQIGGTTLKFVG
jgi:hypothetical protein